MDNQAPFSEWIKKAEEDFQFAKTILEEEKEFFDQICFHFQQAAEKYLKAYIVAKNLEFRKIHELPTILDICVSYDVSFEDLREECEYLTEFYLETRYPTLWPGKTTKEHTRNALGAAERIRNFVKRKLSS